MLRVVKSGWAEHTLGFERQKRKEKWSLTTSGEEYTIGAQGVCSPVLIANEMKPGYVNIGMVT